MKEAATLRLPNSSPNTPGAYASTPEGAIQIWISMLRMLHANR